MFRLGEGLARKSFETTFIEFTFYNPFRIRPEGKGRRCLKIKKLSKHSEFNRQGPLPPLIPDPC